MFSFVTTTVVVSFVAGLVVGWHVLPQPAWFSSLWDKLVK